MISIDQLARIAYEKLNHTATGRPPAIPWTALDIKNKAAWIAAIQAVRSEIERH